MDSFRLYWRQGSGSLIADAALALAGAPVERVEVGPERSVLEDPEYLALNPLAQIPTLIMPDGAVLTETAAMLIMLDDAYPQARLLPPRGTPERAQALRWLMVLATTVYSAAIRFYYSDRFTSDPDERAVAAVRAAAASEMDRTFAIVAEAIRGPYLLGRDFCSVDIYAVMLADWHAPVTGLPVFAEMRAGLLQNPAIAAAWDRHGYAR